MAKMPKPRLSSAKDKRYWCRPGNHVANKNDLVVIEENGSYGICSGCLNRRCPGGKLKGYWDV